MSLKQRVGVFFIFVGGLLLFVFAASVFTPNQRYEVLALLAGGGLLWLGATWRMSKSAGAPFIVRPPPAAKSAPPPRPATAGWSTTVRTGC